MPYRDPPISPEDFWPEEAFRELADPEKDEYDRDNATCDPLWSPEEGP